jgi:hypothetical protein
MSEMWQAARSQALEHAKYDRFKVCLVGCQKISGQCSQLPDFVLAQYRSSNDRCRAVG